MEIDYTGLFGIDLPNKTIKDIDSVKHSKGAKYEKVR